MRSLVWILPIIEMIVTSRCLGIDYGTMEVFIFFYVILRYFLQCDLHHHFALKDILNVAKSRPTSWNFLFSLTATGLQLYRNGNTALDMGDTTSAQAIRQARDQRVAKQQVANDHTQKKPKAKAAPNLLALANAGRARSSKGSGRGTRR